jgi:cell division protein FtsQ
MSAGYDSTSPRFFRPADVARIRRNQRRIQLQRFASTGGKAGIILIVIAGAFLVYHQTRGDSRFAVKTIEVTGVAHTPRASIDAVTRAYVGVNLFKIDIGQLRRDLRSLDWVKRIEAEKSLPDTLRIRIVERTPVALASMPGHIAYVDEDGVPFAELSPTVGDSDLPIVTNAAGAQLQRCVTLLRDLRVRDPQIYSRISEVRPVAPNGFALFDREIGAFVYASETDLSAKWRDLYAVARSEHFGEHGIEYADLRFAGRIVVKPVHPPVLASLAIKPAISTPITN